MHFQTDIIGEPKPTVPTLLRIQRTLGMGSEQMAILLDMSRADYQKLIQDQQDVPARNMMQLCKELNLSFDSVMLDQFCYRTMARQFYGDANAIPKKYVIAGKSKRRVLANLLDFVESVSDWERRLELMRYLQISEAALEDPNGTVNLRCTVEAVEWLYRASRGNSKTIHALGKNIMLGATQSAPLFDEIKRCRSIYELFDSLCSESGLSYRYLEKNFLWEIQKIIPGQSILIRGKLNEEVKEQIGDRHIRSKPGAAVRVAMMSAAPQALGLDTAPVNIVDFFEKRKNCFDVEIDISQFLKMHPKSAFSVMSH